jgi:peptide/nickel transport system substrate-binding protein
MKLKSRWLVLFMTIVALIVSGCSGNSDSKESAGSSTKSKAESGGTLKVAAQAQPDTLDPTVTTAEATRDPARLVFESLVTFNENYEVTPLLAESYDVSKDGKTITFKLRQGVKFHNGNEMKADDVIASMEKWAENSSLTKSTLEGSEWKKVDDYTVELHLKKPLFITMHILADQNQMAAIMPADVAKSAGPSGVTEYIGTGPFKLKEWKKDQYIHFEKFEDYQPVKQPASGLAGEKKALVNEIYWNFVPDISTRTAGLTSGQYDIALGLPHDTLDQIENTPGKKADIWTYGMQILVFNKKEGIFSNEKARQAVNAGLDNEFVLKSAFTNEKFYQLNPGLFLPEQKDWYTDAGKEVYNQKNVEKAKKLLKEAGYKGEEVVILTSREYPHTYNASVATQQQLEKMGMKTKLDVYDWATLLERRKDPSAYDIFFTGWDTAMIPHQYNFLDSKAEWPGWTNSPEMDKLLEEISTAKSQEEAKALTEELQKVFWEYLPVINVGTYNNITAYDEKVQGFKTFIGPVLWNVSVN